jgi:hypothetical protein
VPPIAYALRLVEQRGRVQRVASGFVDHACGGETPEFVANEREMVSRGPALARLGHFEKADDFGHESVFLVGGTTIYER